MMTRNLATAATTPKAGVPRHSKTGGTMINPSLAAITIVSAVMLGLLLVTATLVGQAAPGHSVCRFSEPSIHSTPPPGSRSLSNRVTRGQVT